MSDVDLCWRRRGKEGKEKFATAGVYLSMLLHEECDALTAGALPYKNRQG